MFTTEEGSRPFVRSRWELAFSVIAGLDARAPRFGFDGFGELVYYRTYSRRRADGRQERWADTVRRVVEGIFSIRHDWYRRRCLAWEEGRMQDLAARMADAMFEMRFLPPGRGLYAMGTEVVYEKGAMPLYNCGASTTQSSTYAFELAWIMDALMCGVGVGAEVTQEPLELFDPGLPEDHVVADSREGWVASVVALARAYTQGAALPRFDYSEVRAAGVPLKSIGGVASGPEPLRQLHARMAEAFERAMLGDTSPLRMRADHVNQIGACVTMGDVRRSAEMLIASTRDAQALLDLKDYEKHPGRAPWGWTSNNTLAVDYPDEVPIAARAIAGARGEKPGVLNRMALRGCGDPATLVNPCGEIPLLPRELCNVADVIPSRCAGDAELEEALRLAVFYAQTVSLLPTHQPTTNLVIARNRRIGVSLTGVSGTFDAARTPDLDAWAKIVRNAARHHALESAVPVPCRTTTIKPGGTIPQLAGVTSGMHWAVDNHAIRRIRIGAHSPVLAALRAAGYPPDGYEGDSRSWVYSFPIHTPGRVEREVSLAEQFDRLDLLQRRWADNAVSCTLKYNAGEAKSLEGFLTTTIPRVKTLSVMALEDQASGYKWPPYEAIAPERYAELRSTLPRIDWAGLLVGEDGEDTQFCDATGCTR